MRISDMNWMQVEAYLRHDDRAVLPLGSTEQHGLLSLSVDSILSEKIAADAAEPLGVPVFPVQAYGITPYFLAFPGSISVRVATYVQLIYDLLDNLAFSGFRRILICNGHGGNQPAQAVAGEWMADHPGLRVKFHNWWNAPQVWAKVQAVDPVASHASWMENFPWDVGPLAGVTMPEHQKGMADLSRLRLLSPDELRGYLGDGNYGGLYQRADDELLAIWQAAVVETRELIETGWGE